MDLREKNHPCDNLMIFLDKTVKKIQKREKNRKKKPKKMGFWCFLLEFFG
jgi:hypothetical protein